ncbi:MAG: hypothetical protein GXY44_04010 [Phycisphaerales bacterium]|nr:hypothetical protein [Phycisphaerales bacterium]
MQKRIHARRGVALILVLTLIVAIGGMLSVLATGAAGLYRSRQGQHIEWISRSATDSVAAYARRHLSAWAENPPEGDIQLNIDRLLKEGMTGTCVLSFPMVDGQRLCRITVHIVQHAYGALETLDLPLNPPPAEATISEPSL